ncbi:MAG: hypothetical protein JNK14_07615 [Chitinophagaceae bacterium]|nr:hypothetical protein [Chitinophagaceae bacterium]
MKAFLWGAGMFLFLFVMLGDVVLLAISWGSIKVSFWKIVLWYFLADAGILGLIGIASSVLHSISWSFTVLNRTTSGKALATFGLYLALTGVIGEVYQLLCLVLL